MPEYLIDVVIPAYKEEKYLPLTLDSLSHQTAYKEGLVKIIVCEYLKNPTDSNSRKLVKSYDHTKYVRTHVSGIGFARNLGVLASDSPIIVNFDADAYFNRLDGLELLVEPIVNSEAVLTHCETIYPDGSSANMNIIGDINAIINKLQGMLPIARGSGLSFTREAWQTVGGFPHYKDKEDFTITLAICLHYSIYKKKKVEEVAVVVSDRRINWMLKNPLLAVDYGYAFR